MKQTKRWRCLVTVLAVIVTLILVTGCGPGKEEHGRFPVVHTTTTHDGVFQ